MSPADREINCWDAGPGDSADPSHPRLVAQTDCHVDIPAVAQTAANANSTIGSTTDNGSQLAGKLLHPHLLGGREDQIATVIGPQTQATI
jgi:hypothetical protein